VLSAGPGRAVGVDPQILLENFDLDILVDLGSDKDGGETGLAALAGVERGLTDESMDANFAREQAIGVFALDPEGGALDPRLLARLVVDLSVFIPWRSVQRR